MKEEKRRQLEEVLHSLVTEALEEACGRDFKWIDDIILFVEGYLRGNETLTEEEKHLIGGGIALVLSQSAKSITLHTMEEREGEVEQ